MMRKVRIFILFCMVSVHMQAQVDPIPRPLDIKERPVKQTNPAPSSMIQADTSVQQAILVLKDYLQRQKRLFRQDPKLTRAVENILYYLENEPVDSSVKYLTGYSYQNLYQTTKVTTREVVDTVIREHDSVITLPVLRTDQQVIEHAEDSLSIMERGKTDTLSVIALSPRETAVPQAQRIPFRDTLLVPRHVPDTIITIDSLQFAIVDTLSRSVKILLDKLASDSSQVWLKNLTNDSLQIWMKNGNQRFYRFWLRNMALDSVGVWVENTARNSFRIFLDDGVYIRNLSEKKQINEVEFERTLDERLRKMKKVVIEVPAWTYGGLGSLQFAQGYLSHWVKGGQSSVSALTTLNFFGNYSRGKTKWENTAQIKYGLLKTGPTRLRKNEDIFELNSSFGHKLVDRWYLSILGNMKSQFFRGYNYPNDSVIVSNFLAPGYLVFALGMDYKPNKDFSLLISPLTSKTTIVRDLAHVDPTTYGLEKGQRVKREMGAYIKTRYFRQIVDGISTENKLDLFTSYNNHPERIDVNWETLLRMRINFYTEANISTHLIYDHDIDVPITRVVNGETIQTTGKRIQFKEILSVGFNYKF
jgi:hypothetical protein